MGRRPTRPNAIPRLRVRKRASGKTFYYYDHGGSPRREEPLGSDYGLAIKRWAEIERAGNERPAQVITFRYVAERYRVDVMPMKSLRTQVDNRLELAKLIEFFDDPPVSLDAIAPQHVAQYMDWRRASPVRANREKALFSHIWNFARTKGYTALANPCLGIKGYAEKGRDVYVSDLEFKALWEKADQTLRDALDLAYLTGQRPSDVLRMDELHIVDGAIEVKQRKTDTKIRISIAGELATLIDRMRARKHTYSVYSTRLVVDDVGQPVPIRKLQQRFRTARDAAGLSHLQFRDLRAKAATDKTDSAGDIRKAQVQMGHSSVVMTEHYVRKRRGEKVEPTK